MSKMSEISQRSRSLSEMECDLMRGRHRTFLQFGGEDGNWILSEGAEVNATFTGKATMGKQANFELCNITGIDFSHALLRNANFLGVYAREVNFSGAELSGCLFAHSDLRGASFKGANLTNANFTKALIDGCDFSEADTTGTIFAPAETSANLAPTIPDSQEVPPHSEDFAPVSIPVTDQDVAPHSKPGEPEIVTPLSEPDEPLIDESISADQTSLVADPISKLEEIAAQSEGILAQAREVSAGDQTPEEISKKLGTLHSQERANVMTRWEASRALLPSSKDRSTEDKIGIKNAQDRVTNAFNEIRSLRKSFHQE